MVKGFNKAINEEIQWYSNSYSNPDIKNRPCVFLSHKKEDKSACRKIADYLRDAGIDYYLDEEDDVLQQAAIVKDPIEITNSIKKGIRESSHMIVVISDKTYQSQWVPFEVGYGHAAILDNANTSYNSNHIKLSVLTLKEIATIDLPDFLQVAYPIRGTVSLNQYISDILDKEKSNLILEERIFSSLVPNHELDDVLDWKL